MKKLFVTILVALKLLFVCYSTIAQSVLTPIQFSKQSYFKDGKPFYLISGEFHYFRVPKSDWQKRMKLLKQGGGNCVATYVPWLIHEPKEGVFDFKTEGFKDLEAFLKLAKQEGLYVIVRPGPYQYSELAYDGLPDWLSTNYPQLRAKTFDGKDLKGTPISYQHPLFLKKVKIWFDKVCPILEKYSVNNGGAVAFLQIDNELTGAHFWNGSIDYNAETMGFGKVDGKYPVFLKKKYGSIDKLTTSYGTNFDGFDKVHPIEPKAYDKIEQVKQLKDYYDFYYLIAAEYLDTLATMARFNGIDVPLLHNAANPEMIPYFQETVKQLKSPFLLGMDSYYNLDQNWGQNNPTPQFAVRSFYGLEMLRLISGAIKRASFGNIKNVRKKGMFVLEKMPTGSEILGVEETSGKPIACSIKTEGYGQIIVAGISWQASHNEQNAMLRYFLSKLHYKQVVACDNQNIWHTLRYDGKNAMLFLMNLNTTPQTANLDYTNHSGKLVKLGKINVGRMEVKTIKIDF